MPSIEELKNTGLKVPFLQLDKSNEDFYMSTLCQNCSSETSAEIKTIKINKMKLERPCWHCSSCSLSTPVKKEDGPKWADKFQWVHSFIYGLEVDKDYCIGCEKEGTLYAVTELTRGGDYFPFHLELHPSFCCYRCGFTFKCLEKNKERWTDMYHLWA